MILTRLRSKHLIALVSLAPLTAAFAPPAAAEFFFRPFGQVFHQPIVEEDAAPDVSPRAIASILAEEGFRLVGPLGRRGDQIVVTGVDRRGRQRRFVIDPYEGEILRSWRIEAPIDELPPPAALRRDGRPLPAPSEAIHGAPRASAIDEPMVVPGFGAEPPAVPSSRKRAEPAHRPKTATRPDARPSQRPARHTPPSQATKSPERPAAAAKTIAPAPAEKPVEQSATPAQPTQAPMPPTAAEKPAIETPVEAKTAPEKTVQDKPEEKTVPPRQAPSAPAAAEQSAPPIAGSEPSRTAETPGG
jgi:hypothetical protein